MQNLRYFSIGVLVTLLLLGAFALLVLPGGYHVEQSVYIQASPQTVFEQIDQLRNWKNWALSEDAEPGYQFAFEGAAAGEGAIYTWQGDVSSGRLEIIRSVPYQEIEMTALMQGGKFSATITFLLNKQAEGVQVQWIEKGDFGWHLMTRFTASLLDFEGRMGENYQQGLQKLKEICEAAATDPR
jgi:uncharacterized protein YndB with AHSA1/START domain